MTAGYIEHRDTGLVYLFDKDWADPQYKWQTRLRSFGVSHIVWMIAHIMEDHKVSRISGL